MSDFADELRRKKQAAEEERQRRLAEEAERRKKTEKEEFDRQQVRMQRQQYQNDLFNSLDPMVTKVLKVLGKETWGHWSYYLKREVPEYWLLGHNRGKCWVVRTRTKSYGIEPPYRYRTTYFRNKARGHEGYIVYLRWHERDKQYHFTFQIQPQLEYISENNFRDFSFLNIIRRPPRHIVTDGHITSERQEIEPRIDIPLSQSDLEQALVSVKPIKWVFEPDLATTLIDHGVSGPPRENVDLRGGEIHNL